MSDFFTQTYGVQRGRAAIPSVREAAQNRREDEEYDRNWFERILAPIEAPQQALYQYTIDQESPFLQRAGRAISHGAKYFQPWHNDVRRINEMEVREAFMGEESKNITNKWHSGALNLGIAIAYDPLWLLPPLGMAKNAVRTGMAASEAAGASTRAGANTLRALRVAENIVHPMSAVFDAQKFVNKNAVTPAIRAGADKLLGKDRAARVGAAYQQWMVDRFAGAPEWVKSAVLGREQQIEVWRNEGFEILQGTKRLGGKKAQELLSEAMELDALYYLRKGDDLTAAQKGAFDVFDRKLNEAGFDKDLFFDAYDAMRGLDDKIGRALVKSGAISADVFKDYQGIHARRIFEAFEKPGQYIDRLEALPAAMQADRLTTKQEAVAKAIRTAEHSFVDKARKGAPPGTQSLFPEMGTAGAASGRLRNYIGGDGRIDAERLAKEFDQLVRNNPADSVDDIMRRVNTELFGLSDDVVRAGDKAADFIGAQDAQIYKALANSLSGGLDIQHGAKHYADLLRASKSAPGMGFRTIQENVAVVMERKNIDPMIREALGEIKTAAPRMASEVNKSGVLAETMELFDTLSGAQRMSGDAADVVRRLNKKELPVEEAREALATILGKNADEIDLNAVRKLREGDIIERTGNEVAAFGKTSPEGMYGAYKLADDSRYGSLSGAWVTPSVHRIVTNIAGTPGIPNPVEAAFFQAGRAVKAVTQTFKLMKVVYDPTAQARNFWGNAIMASFAGTNPLDMNVYGKAFRTVIDINTGKTNQYLDALNRHGASLLMGRGYTASELGNLGNALVRETANIKGNDAVALSKAFFNALGSAHQGFHNAATTSFANTERLFRGAVFIDNFDKLRHAAAKKGVRITHEMEGNFVRQAVAKSEEALFNYADIPYAVQFARDYGLIPFVTFPYKAAGLTAKAAYEAPHRITAWHRTANTINDMGSGSPEETAREVAALPPYMRDALVLRMPFDDKDGRPQYIDLSYFMPYQVIKELAEVPGQIGGLLGMGDGDRHASPGDFGLRGGYFSPPALAFMDMIRRGEDGQGRPMFKPEFTAEQNFAALGNALAEFVLPPSFWGGSRAETFGRALQGVARTTDEPMEWAEWLASYMRGPGPDSNQVFGRTNQRPASGSLVGGSQFAAALGLDQGSGIAPLLGIAESFMTGGATASDPILASRTANVQANVSSTELMRQRAQVMARRDLTTAEKQARVARLMEKYRAVQAERATSLRNMR